MGSDIVTIVVADRNPRVREILRREFTDQGYVVVLACSGQDVVGAVVAIHGPGLVILDPEVTGAGPGFAETLPEINPGIIPVLHVLPPECGQNEYGDGVAVIEKNGDLNRLRAEVERILGENECDLRNYCKSNRR